MTAAVVVYVDRSPTTDSTVLRWAAAESRRRNAPLHVVVTNGQWPGERDSLVTETREAIHDAVPGLIVLRRSAQRPVSDALCKLSADAGAIVVQASLPGVEAVVANSFCPVFVLPDPLPAEHGPVALGLAPWTGEEVIDLAFQEATRRHTRLVAVRTWTDPQLNLSTLRPDQLHMWDRRNDRARREVDLALSAWRVIFPDVEVDALVVQDRTADFLFALTGLSQLLVLGRSARGALLATIAGSPVSELLPRARCPLLVVPAEGPPRRSWLPSSTHGWTFTGR